MTELLLLTILAQDLRPEQPLNEAEKGWVAAGIQLHDQEKFAEAIAQYRKALEQNPDNALVWYELAFSQSSLKQWKACSASASKGREFASPQRPALSMVLANCLDFAGETAQALDTYQSALDSMPPETPAAQKAMIHFNMGVTLRNKGDFAQAKQQYQAAIRLNPRHGSSHLQLADLYLKSNDRIPALLALGVFLSLEPSTSTRAADAAASVKQLLGAGVSRTGKNNIRISVDAGNDKNPEGNFGPESTILGITGAGRMMTSNKKPVSEFGRMTSLWTSLTGTMLREDRREKLAATFAGQTYFSFYQGIADRKLMPAFVSRIFESAALPVTNEEKEALQGSKNMRDYIEAWPAK